MKKYKLYQTHNDEYKKAILDIFEEKLRVETRAYPHGKGYIHNVSFEFDGREYSSSSVSEKQSAYENVQNFIEEFYNKPLKTAVKELEK